MSTGEPIALWPGVAPGSEDWGWDEREVRIPLSPTDDLVFQINVVRPTLTPVLPDPAVANGTAVLVCPGGAYTTLAIDHEGFAVARWLAERGFAAFVLKYRVMRLADDAAFMDFMIRLSQPGGLDEVLERMNEFAPLPRADAEAAMRLIHERAGEWRLRADRIGAVGFSAGARLVLELATGDDHAVRPAFAGSIYGPGGEGVVPDDAPPLFIAVAADDALFEYSLQAHAAWRSAGRPVEAHLYAAGGHGFGMRAAGLPCDHWIEQFDSWLRALYE